MKLLKNIWTGSSGKKLLWSSVGMLVFGAVVMTSFFGLIEVNSDASLDTTTFYTAETVKDYLEMQGPEGRRGYLMIHAFDYVFLVFLFLFLTRTITCLGRRFDGDRLRFILVFPLIYAIFDLIENISIDISILIFPSQLPVIPHLMGYFTLIKMSAVYVSFAFIVFLGIASLFNKR